MRWQGRRQSDNVEDQRGAQGGGIGGGFGRGGGLGGPGFRIVRGGGISGILILVVMFFVLRAVGIDPLPILFGDGSMGPSVTQQAGQSGRTAAEGGAVANDETTQFARTVLAETEDVWSAFSSHAARPTRRRPWCSFPDRFVRLAALLPRRPGRFIAPAIASSTSI